jgi:hypothetical protein
LIEAPDAIDEGQQGAAARAASGEGQTHHGGKRGADERGPAEAEHHPEERGPGQPYPWVVADAEGAPGERDTLEGVQEEQAQQDRQRPQDPSE